MREQGKVRERELGEFKEAGNEDLRGILHELIRARDERLKMLFICLRTDDNSALRVKKLSFHSSYALQTE